MTIKVNLGFISPTLWWYRSFVQGTAALLLLVRLSLHTGQVAHQAGAYPGFCSMKRLGVFLLLPGWDASPSEGYPPSIKFASTHLYTWVERCTVKIKCLAQEHNAMALARAWTWIAQSGATVEPPEPLRLPHFYICLSLSIMVLFDIINFPF